MLDFHVIHRILMVRFRMIQCGNLTAEVLVTILSSATGETPVADGYLSTGTVHVTACLAIGAR